MESPKGKCAKCGKYYLGWALLNPEHQRCEECGGRIEIEHDNSSNEDLQKFSSSPWNDLWPPIE
jgi:rRNA maturation endonuclease Nob1